MNALGCFTSVPGFSQIEYCSHSGADTGMLQWFQLKPLLKERATLSGNDWSQKQQKLPPGMHR